MKRTFRSHFLNVGTIDERDGIVDKRPTWGRAYRDAIEAELAGVQPIHNCDLCNATLTIDNEATRASYISAHERTAGHLRRLEAKS